MNSYNSRGRGQLLGAFLLITAGILIFLVENHLITGADLKRLWPVILIAFGVAKLRQSGGAVFGGITLIAAGVLFELEAFHYIQRPERLWPLILVAAGGALLWKALRPPQQDQGQTEKSRLRWNGTKMGGGDSFAIFGGVERRITDPEFAGTELTAIFGGYNVDLRKALMKGDTAFVTVTAVCGGVELQIPETWDVELAGSPIFGGFSDETTHPDRRTNPPRLVIQGSVVFGGVNVKN